MLRAQQRREGRVADLLRSSERPGRFLRCGRPGDTSALNRLQALRDQLGKPLIVGSAYWSPERHRAVGGATRSKHLDGAAFDIAMVNHDPEAFEAAAREVGFLGFGFYPRSGFIDVDLGSARQWGERFPARDAAFAVESRQRARALRRAAR